MKTKLTYFLCSIFMLTAFSLEAKPKAKRVVMIALDGISVEGLLKAKTPHIDALLKDGSLSLTTRDVMPSVTLPNWTSIMTGSGPEQHGVVDNGWTPKKIKLPAITTGKEGYYPSVFTLLKENVKGVKTAFYYNWVNLFHPYNKKHLDEVCYLKEDAYIPYYEKAFDFIVENKKNPTLVFLYSVHTDHAGHKHGWMSPEYIRSIEDADVQIGVFLDKMKNADLYEKTHFMFLTDHGGIKRGHGGFTLKEMELPWGIVGPGVKKDFRITEPNNTVNTASTILYLFGVKQPLPWTGEVIESIWGKK